MHAEIGGRPEACPVQAAGEGEDGAAESRGARSPPYETGRTGREDQIQGAAGGSRRDRHGGIAGGQGHPDLPVGGQPGNAHRHLPALTQGDRGGGGLQPDAGQGVGDRCVGEPGEQVVALGLPVGPDGEVDAAGYGKREAASRNAVEKHLDHAAVGDHPEPVGAIAVHPREGRDHRAGPAGRAGADVDMPGGRSRIASVPVLLREEQVAGPVGAGQEDPRAGGAVGLHRNAVYLGHQVDVGSRQERVPVQCRGSGPGIGVVPDLDPQPLRYRGPCHLPLSHPSSPVW